MGKYYRKQLRFVYAYLVLSYLSLGDVLSESSLTDSRASVPVYLLNNSGGKISPKLVCMESDRGFKGKFDMRVVKRVQLYSSIQFSG